MSFKFLTKNVIGLTLIHFKLVDNKLDFKMPKSAGDQSQWLRPI